MQITTRPEDTYSILASQRNAALDQVATMYAEMVALKRALAEALELKADDAKAGEGETQ